MEIEITEEETEFLLFKFNTELKMAKACDISTTTESYTIMKGLIKKLEIGSNFEREKK